MGDLKEKKAFALSFCFKLERTASEKPEILKQFRLQSHEEKLHLCVSILGQSM
jgi:hypothetical protein